MPSGNETATTAVSQNDVIHRVWSSPGGLGRFAAVSNTVVAGRFMVTGFIFFLIGGVLALLMRTQLMVPENDLLSGEVYNQLFTMHGTTMMFLFAVPIMEAFGLYLIPGMIGARDVCFPRLTAYGYWCYLFGGILLYSSFLIGQVPDGGWFMYVPLTSAEFSPTINQDFWLLGVTFVEIASISGALELVATILKTRAPGMSLNRMPIFAWYILATSFMILFGFPPLVLGSILLESQRAFGLPFFDHALGGDALLWQHLFWIFGHPEVYIIFLPAAGLVSMMLPVLARTRLVAYEWLVLAVIATAFLSFGLWVHHMYATGISFLALSFFAGASMAVAIPSGIQIFAWLATLWQGRPQLYTPMLFIIGFLIIFVIGGLTGVMVAVVPFNWQAHDSYFVVAHLHYVLIGGMVFPLFAALAYYMPRLTGRLLSETGGKLSFWLMFIGFNVAFLPMHITGLAGMPRRIFTYSADAGWNTLNMISTLGAYVLASGVLVFIVNVFWHLKNGRPAGVNPWNAAGLEWAGPTPAANYNIRSIPEISSREPLWDQPGLQERIEGGEEYLADAADEKRETLVTSLLDAQAEYVERLPFPTFMPLMAAVTMAVMFASFLVAAYTVSAAAAGVLALLFAIWLWEPPLDKEFKDIGKGQRLRIMTGDYKAPRWIGAVLLVFVDVALFASLVYSYFYLWTAAGTAAWPPSGYQVVAGWPVIAALVLLAGTIPGVVMLQRSCARGTPALGYAALILNLLLFTGLSWVGIEAYQDLSFSISEHAYTALIKLFGLYLGLHYLLVIGTTVFALARLTFVDMRNGHLAMRVSLLFAAYTGVLALIVYALVYLTAA